jgi:hypothetical protein
MLLETFCDSTPLQRRNKFCEESYRDWTEICFPGVAGPARDEPVAVAVLVGRGHRRSDQGGLKNQGKLVIWVLFNQWVETNPSNICIFPMDMHFPPPHGTTLKD